jgi:hypothetical protein
MRVGSLARLIVLSLLPFTLVACGGRSVSESFGVTRRAPDEFQVVRRAPLVVPPDYRLRPPAPGTEGPATSSSQHAYSVLTGAPPATTAELSPGEQALLERAPGNTLPNVRQIVNQEDSQTVVLDRGVFLFILDWQQGAYQDQLAQRDIIDPVLESERLRNQGIVQTARTSSTPLTPGY